MKTEIIHRSEIHKVMIAFVLLFLHTSISYGSNAIENNTSLSNEIESLMSISGKVTDDSDAPLPGVNIIKLGTTDGAVTDLNGDYTIDATSGDILEFTFIGMETVKITVGEQSVINVSMKEDYKEIDEIVVVGYSTKSKALLTGAVSSVNAKELVKAPASNTTALLTGQVPGLITRQTSGVPGNDGTALSIRGYGKPLVLVDGVQTSMARVDPNDIESISVLKDASAAIYGARAGNGVILITTKRGEVGDAKISYHGNISFQNPTVLPKKVDSWDYADLWRESRIVTGLDPNDRFTVDDVFNYRQGNNPEYVNQDWYGQIFRTRTPMQQHNLSVRGGSEKIKYYASVGLLDQNSAFRSGDLEFKRYNMTSNLDAQISDNLSMGFDLAIRQENRYKPRISVSKMYNLLSTAQPIYPAILPDPTRAAYSGFSQRSPYAATQDEFAGFDDDKRLQINGSIAMNYDFSFIEGFSMKGVMNFVNRNESTKELSKPYDVWEYVDSTQQYLLHGTQNARSSIFQESKTYRQFYPSVSMNYKKVTENHIVKALFVAESIDVSSDDFSARRFDLISTDIPYLFAGGQDGITNDGGASESGRMSYVGEVEYNYKYRYFIDGTFRADATGEKFAKDSRWGYFPSILGAWMISNEDFMSDKNAVDNLKLRTSYSRSGVDSVASFRHLSGYQIQEDNVFLVDGETGQVIRSTGLANPNVTWQDNTTYNVGMDGSFWNKKLGFSLNVFYRKTTGIFGTPKETVPTTFGATLPQLNINSQSDRGFDLMLTHENRISDDFSYSISGNIGLARKKWLSISEDLSEDPEIRAIDQKEGKYTNRVIGYVSNGQFMTQEQIDNHPVNQDQAENSTLIPGDIIYKDLNGDGLIDSKDRADIGFFGNPDLSYGINAGAIYKSFSFSFLFQGAAYSSMTITAAARSPFSNESIPFDYHREYRWQPDPNDPSVNINPNAQLPAITGVGTSQNNNLKSDFWLRSNNYFRLKSMNIAYTVNPDRLSRWGIDNLVIYVAGNNLFTFSQLGIYKDAFDPEMTDNNGNQGGRSYPLMKTISFGLRLTLK